jgi:hypothetical protein
MNYDEIYCCALVCVRDSGVYNMVSEFNRVWSAALCILAMWGRQDAIAYAVSGPRYIHRQAFEKYTLGTPDDFSRWIATVEVMPFGKSWISAAEGFKSNVPSERVLKYKEYTKDQNLSPQRALLCVAEATCYDNGVFARDVARIRAALGLVKSEDLQMIGAQLMDEV